MSLVTKTEKSHSVSVEIIALERRIFRNKRILLLVLAACILEVVLSGRSINRAAASAHDWIYIGGLLFSIWIVGALACRTTFIKERLLFASVSVAIVLYAVLAVMLPSQPIVHILRWIILLMWASATTAGIAILFERKEKKHDVAKPLSGMS